MTLVLRNLIGDIDGVNQVFTTPTAYRSNTIALWVNGQLKVASNDDGFVEVDATTVELRIPPQVGEVLQVMYTQK